MKKIKIPDVCGGLSVPYINTPTMLRLEGARFVVARFDAPLGTTAPRARKRAEFRIRAPTGVIGIVFIVFLFGPVKWRMGE